MFVRVTWGGLAELMMKAWSGRWKQRNFFSLQTTKQKDEYTQKVLLNLNPLESNFEISGEYCTLKIFGEYFEEYCTFKILWEYFKTFVGSIIKIFEGYSNYVYLKHIKSLSKSLGRTLKMFMKYFQPPGRTFKFLESTF